MIDSSEVRFKSGIGALLLAYRRTAVRVKENEINDPRTSPPSTHVARTVRGTYLAPSELRASYRRDGITIIQQDDGPFITEFLSECFRIVRMNRDDSLGL